MPSNRDIVRQRQPQVHPEDLIYKDSKHYAYYTRMTLLDDAAHENSSHIQVGDTVAVARRNTTAVPCISPQTNNDDNKWWPFSQAWSPAQVLALYQTPFGKFQVKLKWFHWLMDDDDDDTVHHRDYNDTDWNSIPRENVILEHYSSQVLQAKHVLGRIYLTSSGDHMTRGTIDDNDNDGVPRIQLQCRHAIVVTCDGNEEIQEIHDWNWSTNGEYPKTVLDRALSHLNNHRLEQETRRAMMMMNGQQDESSSLGESTCSERPISQEEEEEEEGTTVQSSQSTEENENNDTSSKATEEEPTVDDETSADSFECNTSVVVRIPSPQSSQEEKKSLARDDETLGSDATDPFADCDAPFYTSPNNGESYYSKLQIASQPQHYAVKRCRIIQSQWTIAVGNLLAVQHEDSSQPSNNGRQPWYPFSTPWSPAQVLALSFSNENGYSVHVRWFYRRREFQNLEKAASAPVKQLLRNNDASSLADKIVYEFGVYGKVDLHSILGRVVLTSEDAPYESYFRKVQGEGDGIPQAPLVCRSSMSQKFKDVTDIDDWNRTCTSGVSQLERGIQEYMADDQRLLEATLSLFQRNAKKTPSVGAAAGSLFSLSSTKVPTRNDSDVANDESPHSVVSRNAGDIATFASPLSKASTKVPTSNDGGDAVMNEEMKPSAPSRKPPPTKGTCARRTNLPDKKEVPTRRSTKGNKRPTRGTKRLVMTLDPPTKKRPTRGTKRRAEETSSDARPKKAACSVTNSTVDKMHFDTTMSNFINDSGSVRTTPSPVALIPSPRTESVSSPASTVTKDDDRIFIPNGLLPFHQDFAALKSYYSEIEVVPPLYNYVESIRSNSKFDGRWTVKMGDVVAVHYRQGAGRISFGSANESDKDTHFPYTVPWAIAEVVTIWREYDSVDEMNKSKRKRNACAAQDDVKIELRWFYRKGELPGAAKTVTVSENATKHLEYEEIFETDLMDHCDATSLLSPAKLHESAKRCGLSKMQQGMPLIDVHCCQFFSIHRKALLPIGGMSGRIERGRMHSKYFGKGGVLNLAWNDFKNDNTTENKAIPSIHAPKKWKRAFKEVIERLGLSAASDDASVQGIQLTGREAEQEKIMTFLRSRIDGSVEEEDDDDDSEDDDESAQSHVAINASLFIAGPPGTGKTASVLSVIARLRKEQANGKIPEFDFVSLNGMEMRHPFEAYVKFWEMISGPSKQKCPPEVAVAKLERHFAGRGGTDEDDKNSKQIVVLLLDEIDYLVTKKQTVLYNFFDWPRRTCENGCGPRLIVVGISNTLNLPSRLKPSVQSRLGSETCGYKSYNVKDMIAILKTKIQSDKADDAYQVFEEDAIQFAARKTAALSGDIRKALHLCKAAAEAVMKDVELGNRVDPKEGSTRSGPIVRISDVQKASRESFSSILSTAVSFSTSFEALLLVSLASLTQSTGRHDGGFDINELITKMESISGGSGDVQYSPSPSFGETLEILNRLGETRLVSLHTPKSSSVTFRASQGGSGGAWPLISLPMDPSNLRKALRDTPHSALAEKYITTY